MMPFGQRKGDSSLVAPRAAGEQQVAPEGYKRPMEANVDSATVSHTGARAIRGVDDSIDTMHVTRAERVRDC
jgi:hypothetical protein